MVPALAPSRNRGEGSNARGSDVLDPGQWVGMGFLNEVRLPNAKAQGPVTTSAAFIEFVPCKQ